MRALDLDCLLRGITLLLASLLIGVILLGGGVVLATDTPFIYNGTSWAKIENLPQLGTTINNIPIAEIFDQNIEPKNEKIMRLAMDLAIKYPGSYKIGQIIAIYEYMIKNWCYVEHSEHYDPAHDIITDSVSSGCSGRGNCNDFAIVMTSLLEAVGYSTRVVHAYSNESGHAYAEVYLGTRPQVDAVIKWLHEYYKNDIYLHINNDPNTKDVWLNLDWQRDSMERYRLGGPFFEADENYVVWMTKKPAKPYVQAGPLIPEYPIEITNLKNGSLVQHKCNVEGISKAGRSGMKAYLLICPNETLGPWWVQETATSPNGDWNSNAIFGNAGNIDNGKCFTVMAIITREDLSVGQQIRVLPPVLKEFKSKEIIVCRGI